MYDKTEFRKNAKKKILICKKWIRVDLQRYHFVKVDLQTCWFLNTVKKNVLLMFIFCIISCP